MDVQLLRMLADVKKVGGSTGAADCRVAFIPASLILERHCENGALARRTRERDIVSVRVRRDFVSLGVHDQKISDLHGLSLGESIAKYSWSYSRLSRGTTLFHPFHHTRDSCVGCRLSDALSGTNPEPNRFTFNNWATAFSRDARPVE